MKSFLIINKFNAALFCITPLMIDNYLTFKGIMREPNTGEIEYGDYAVHRDRARRIIKFFDDE